LLNKKQKERCKNFLEKQLAEINQWEEQYPNPPSPKELALCEGSGQRIALIEQRNQQWKAKEVRRADILAAQKREKDGTFGLCKDCGGEIESARLLGDPKNKNAYFNPAAGRCRQCQIEHVIAQKNGNHVVVNNHH
jgi:RNA polymerase-binding transcription factor DksA